MSVRHLNKQVKAACQNVHQVLDHQLPVYRFLFIVLTLVFLLSLLIVPTELAVEAYMLTISFMMAFTQLNHWMAEKLTDFVAAIREELIEYIDHLREQMSIWRQLFCSFLAVNPRPKVAFFDRLSDLLALTQLPLLSAPLAFRS